MQIEDDTLDKKPNWKLAPKGAQYFCVASGYYYNIFLGNVSTFNGNYWHKSVLYANEVRTSKYMIKRPNIWSKLVCKLKAIYKAMVD